MREEDVTRKGLNMEGDKMWWIEAHRIRALERDAALLQVKAMLPVVEAAQKLIHTERWPYLIGGGFLAHAIDDYEKGQPKEPICGEPDATGVQCTRPKGHPTDEHGNDSCAWYR